MNQEPDLHDADDCDRCMPPVRQAHAAHHKFENSGPILMDDADAFDAVLPTTQVDSSMSLPAELPAVIAQLEQLDDAVFDAVQGRSEALAELQLLWPQLLGELGEYRLAESREQYIRYALSIWRDDVRTGTRHDPERAFYTLEVLCVLYDEGR